MSMSSLTRTSNGEGPDRQVSGLGFWPRIECAREAEEANVERLLHAVLRHIEDCGSPVGPHRSKLLAGTALHVVEGAPEHPLPLESGFGNAQSSGDRNGAGHEFTPPDP